MPSYFELALSLVLTLACCLLSLWRRDDVEKDLSISAARTVVQISLLGIVLKWIFAHPSLWLTGVLAAFMTINSAIHSQSRVKSKYPKLLLDSLTATAISIWPLGLLGSFLLKANPWWRPELFLPLLGMLLGNVLNGISLGVDQFTSDLKTQRDETTSVIALGATVKEATDTVFKKSIRTALTPMINAMSSMGLVSIPGMMTGQILGGQGPQEAAIIQIIMMILIAAGVYFGVLAGLSLARNRLYDERGLPCF
jgi:putative ABC transport system permease protein